MVVVRGPLSALCFLSSAKLAAQIFQHICLSITGTIQLLEWCCFRQPLTVLFTSVHVLRMVPLDVGVHQGAFHILITTVIVMDFILVGLATAGVYIHMTKPLSIPRRNIHPHFAPQTRAKSLPHYNTRKINRSVSRRAGNELMKWQGFSKPCRIIKHSSFSRRRTLESISELRELRSATRPDSGSC